MSARCALRVELALLACAMAWVLPTPARACDLTIIPVLSQMRVEYDPFAPTHAGARLSFDIENRGERACEGELALLDGARNSVDAQQIDGTEVELRFVAASDDAALWSTASPGLWRFTAAGGRRTRVTIDGVVSRDAVAAAGEHAADLSLELRDPGTTVTHTAPVPVQVVLFVLPLAQMNIVGAVGTFGEGASVTAVDFGIITGPTTRRVFLQIRANGSARLTIDSINRGRLLREGGAPNETGIPYAAQVGNDPVDLARHWERLVDTPRTVAGTSLPLDLIINGTPAAIAGKYSDTLTVEFSAL